MSTKTLVIAAATALTALFSAAGGASAHGHKHGFFHEGPRFRVIVGPSYNCGYYHNKWMNTGSFYWKRRYYECKGWW